MNRREFIKASVITAGLIGSGMWLPSCGRRSQSTPKTPLNLPIDGGLLGYYRPSGRFTITAQPSYVEIFSGTQTRLLTYQIGSYVNPIIVLKKGGNFEVDFQNGTGEHSIIHWHGFRAEWRADGHPSYAVGDSRKYSYPSINIIDRSGTYFYHPHPHGRTGYQVYAGLGGMLIIEDDDEFALRQALDLELGKTDIPLIIQDKSFNSDGSIRYSPMGMNGNMGIWGDTLLVNLTPNPYFEVERRIYRFRLLNASNARPYRIALYRGSEALRFWVIGVEGGLLESAVEVREILISPGERIDILVDFRDVNVDDVLIMRSLAHGLVGMGGGMGGSLINKEFDVLELRVVKDSTYDRNIPGSLSQVSAIDTRGTTNLQVPLGMSSGKFNIDGKVWDSSDMLKDYGYNFSNGEVAVIEFVNNTGMYHPIHLHGFQFQVLSRLNSPSTISRLLLPGKGVMATDLGWKDTVIVAPHETVRIAVRFSHNFGSEQVYLLHCHILEHHDNGMMVNYRVAQ